MKNRLLRFLLLIAIIATFSISLAATPPPRINETSASVSQFAASHQRIKAKLTTEDREILDQLSAKVRKSVPKNAQIPGDVIKILCASTHGLSKDEIEALASYVSGEISTENSLLQATQQCKRLR